VRGGGEYPIFPDSETSTFRNWCTYIRDLRMSVRIYMYIFRPIDPSYRSGVELSVTMGACVCRANPDNETMSVSSASISRPASAGEWPSPCLLYIRLYSPCTYTYSRHRHGRCAQEPTALPRDHPVAIGRPTHRGAAEVQEGRVLGHGARL